MQKWPLAFKINSSSECMLRIIHYFFNTPESYFGIVDDRWVKGLKTKLYVTCDKLWSTFRVLEFLKQEGFVLGLLTFFTVKCWTCRLNNSFYWLGAHDAGFIFFAINCEAEIVVTLVPVGAIKISQCRPACRNPFLQDISKRW